MKNKTILRLQAICLCAVLLLSAVACRDSEIPGDTGEGMTPQETSDQQSTFAETDPTNLTGTETEPEADAIESESTKETDDSDTKAPEISTDSPDSEEEPTVDPNQGEWDPQ